jgi:ribosomal protein S18 acetylase RimI-like enzyme
MKNNIEIKTVNKWPNDEIIKLYKAGGWWKENYNTNNIKNLIEGSYKFAIVIDKNIEKVIGMGRILSDGISDAYIQDLIILPDYRNQGIGKKLVKYLIDICLKKEIKWIGLIAEPNQDEFYSKIGFSPMKNYVPMIYKIDD